MASAMFDTTRLTIGENEVKEIYEVADMLGYEVIKLTYGTNGGHQSSMLGFEVGKFADSDGRGYGTQSVLDGGHLHFYPDKRLTKWAFMLDTEKNFKMCAASFADTTFNIADAKYKERVEKYCIENNIRTVPVVSADPYRLKSQREASAENKANDLEQKIKQMQAEMEKMKIEKEEAEVKAQNARDHAERYTDTSVTVTMYDESTGEGVEQEVKAVLPGALTPNPLSNDRTKRAGKPLAKKTIR